jgi:hypothetical protein
MYIPRHGLLRISARCPSLLALLLPLNNTSTHRWESAAAIFWGIAAVFGGARASATGGPRCPG